LTSVEPKRRSCWRLSQADCAQRRRPIRRARRLVSSKRQLPERASPWPAASRRWSFWARATSGSRSAWTDTAASLLIAAGDNPQRLRSEAAFAHLCGVAPIPASSGKVARHRLNRRGNRDANRALYAIAFGRMRRDRRTRDYVARVQPRASPRRRSSAV
jgi:transposase